MLLYIVAADGDPASSIDEFVKTNFLMEKNDYNRNKLDDRLTEDSQNTDRKGQYFMMTGLTSTESDDVDLIGIQFEEDRKESMDLHSEYPLLNRRTYNRFKRGSWNRGKVCTCRSDKNTAAWKESGKPPTTKSCTCKRRTNKPKTIHRRRRPTIRRSHKSTSKRPRLSKTDKKRLRASKHRHSKRLGCKKDSTVRKDDKTATLEQSGKSDLEKLLGVKDEHSTESDQEQTGSSIHEWLDWSPIQESLDLALNEAPSEHDTFTDHIPMEFNDHNQMTSEKLHSNKEAQQLFDKQRGHSPEIQSEAVWPGHQAQGNGNIEADSVSRDTTQMEHQQASNSPKLQKSEKKRMYDYYIT